MIRNIKKSKGITVPELLVAIAIFIILTALTAGAFSNLRKNTDLNSAVETGTSLLAEARSRTLSSRNASEYGVRFDADKIVLFKGATFSATNPDNNEVSLPRGIEISSISLNGGGTDVVFERLTGKTNQHGTVTFRLMSDPSKNRAITILTTGSVEQ